MSWRTAPLTIALIVINIALYGLDALSNHELTIRFGLFPAAVQQGEWWRLLTYAFMHGSWQHVLINMYALLQAGIFVEYCYGTPRYGLIYLAGLIGGGIAAYLTTIGTQIYTVGASGAIVGIFGAMGVLGLKLPRMRGALLRAALFPIVLTLGYGLIVPNVSNWGHIGGLIAGGLFALLLNPVRGRELALADGSSPTDEPEA
ncbi:MAG: rhomboid family intramembrane serine protease [Candidatus Eremiobacteraeota bacterium]|nr:rhomboid family intramembrane serine protease [Candidatus Eremiobacteraeota bacterium]MBV8366007.1 rhomboid family intramembrane serine protease [Candidatus Eremiobacteraeota bacterium]